MRLLLLLSALFTALAGITGTQAQAQPVQTSASRAVPAAAAAASDPVEARIVGVANHRLLLVQPPLPALPAAVRPQPLYAGRRRE